MSPWFQSGGQASPLAVFPGVGVTPCGLSHSHASSNTKPSDWRVVPVAVLNQPTPVLMNDRRPVDSPTHSPDAATSSNEEKRLHHVADEVVKGQEATMSLAAWELAGGRS